jgi:glyoxylate reductase
MALPSVHATRLLPPRVEQALAASFSLSGDRAGVEGLVTIPVDPVDGAFLDGVGPQLRVVAQFGVGYDNVDLPAATERGVLVTNTPDVLIRAVAELTIGLILALLRRIPEGDRLIRRGDPWQLEPTFLLGRELAGRTLGLVGYGSIGREVGRLGEALGMRVLHARRTGGTPLRDVLAEADVVSIHTPLTEATTRLIGAEELAAMRRDSVLVNTSRGPVVDEQALVEALQRGTIAGAALDVFEREPEVPAALLELDNVVLTPHVGSATVEAREAMGMLCVEALRAVLLEGRAPGNALNPEAL